MDMTTFCTIAIVAIKTAVQSVYSVGLHVIVNSVQIAVVAIVT
jgi:hypothetical protein